MNTFFRYCIIFILFIFPFSASAYSLITKNIDGYRVKVFHIPHDDKYQVEAVASTSSTDLGSLIKSHSGIAGINGAYFIPRDYTGNPDETNTIRIIQYDGYSYSKYYPDTGINGIFGFMNDGSPVLLQNNIYGNKKLAWNMNKNLLLEVESGIANFPILLWNGTDLIPQYENAGYITEKMRGKSHKSFICRTEANDIKMGVIEKISIISLPSLLTKIGCTDAINLDNGGSLNMIDRGKSIYKPGRKIMDAYIITPR